MAGNAAGIAKANAARLAKRAALEAAARRGQAATVEVIPANEATEGNGNEADSRFLPVGVVAPVAPGQVPGNQTLAMHELGAGAVDAARFMVQTVKNRKANTQTRLTAAIKVLEFNGFGQKGGGSDGDGEHEATLAKLATALGARMPRAPVTIDAEPATSSREPGPVS